MSMSDKRDMRTNVNDFVMSLNENTIKFIRLPKIPKQRMTMNRIPIMLLEQTLYIRKIKSILSKDIFLIFLKVRNYLKGRKKVLKYCNLLFYKFSTKID